MHNVTLPERYDDLLSARMKERGVNRSEALRQYIDEATAKGGSYKSKVIREQLRIIRSGYSTLPSFVGSAIQAAISTIEELA
ncbi:MAG TPA: ribbon-helix-helix protein, CopG family [Humisphaera sp.]|jgi:hypothetical protein|nr:ribbon-helix-helix protein, CopG family [Humisphaera sp.]